jgi:hypothetical protein
MFDSTIISSVGMLALCLSSFTPTSRFGCLMAAQMVASLLGELVFLPALLCLAPSRRQPVPAPAAEAEADDGPEIRALPLRPHFNATPSRKVRRSS